MPRGGRPPKVSYEVVHIRWALGRRFNPNLSKATLARELGLSIRTVRSILNYRRTEKPRELARQMRPSKDHTVGVSPQQSTGLICGWDFFDQAAFHFSE
jgi:AraC-like DNA-binding protein